MSGGGMGGKTRVLISWRAGAAAHVALWHTPRPEQSLGHARREQSSPVQPGLQWHVRSWQVPAPEHSLGHVLMLHESPRHAGWQTHVPLRQ